MGRRRVEIERIEDKSRRQTTFTKRRQGLFKKASEYATICGGEVAVITFSNAGNCFGFGNPSVQSVVDRYLATTADDSPEDHNNDEVADQPETEMKTGEDPTDELRTEREVGENPADELETEMKIGEYPAEEKSGGDSAMWDRAIEDLDIDGLEKLKADLEDLKMQLQKELGLSN